MPTSYIIGFSDAVFVTESDGVVNLVSGYPIVETGASVSTVTADSGRTADSTCWTADGKIVCSDVYPALFDDADAFPASVLVSATSLTASLFDDADGFYASSVAVEALLAAALFDDADAFHTSAIAVEGGETPTLLSPALFDDADAFHASAVAVETLLAPALVDDADAFPVAAVAGGEQPPAEVVGGGGYYYRPRRPFPVVGVGVGVLPELWGEAHGVVGVAGKSAAQVFVHAAAVGAVGQAGNAAVVLKYLKVAGKGAVGTRGSGEGSIKFSVTATGRYDDDEAAVMTFLLAA